MATTTTPAPEHDVPRARSIVDAGTRMVAGWLAAHSITALRISLGLVFVAFGALKLVPGTSPVEPLVERTIDALTLGIVPAGLALPMTAVVEVFIGVTLISGRWLRAGLLVMAGAMVGILSPTVLFFGDLFPGMVPTLEGQYVLKDIVLVAGAAVVAAQALGARFTVEDEREAE